MKLIYMEDVDTLEVVLRPDVAPVAETLDGPKENILMHFDAEERLVGMVIENASKRTDFEDLKASPHFERPEETVVDGPRRQAA